MMPAEFELLTGQALYDRVIQKEVVVAQRYVWIATANLKNMHVLMPGGKSQSVLEVFNRLANNGVIFRIVHAELPSRPFRSTLEKFPLLTGGAMELQVCPRSHWKLIIVDGRFAYCGSANFTGAGLGARGKYKRNFEIGLVTTNESQVAYLQDLFDSFWQGNDCPHCSLRKACPDPILP